MSELAYIKILAAVVFVGGFALGTVVLMLIKSGDEVDKRLKELDEKIKCATGALVAAKGVSVELQTLKETIGAFCESFDKKLAELREKVEKVTPYISTTNANNETLVKLGEDLFNAEQRLIALEDNENSIELKSDLLKLQNRASILENSIKQIDENFKELAQAVNENASGVLALIDFLQSAGARDSTAEKGGGNGPAQCAVNIDGAPAPEAEPKKAPKTAKKASKTAPKIPVTAKKSQKTPEKAPTSVQNSKTTKQTGGAKETQDAPSMDAKTAKEQKPAPKKSPAAKKSAPKTAKKSAAKTTKTAAKKTPAKIEKGEGKK